MPDYEYTAKNKAGESITGKLTADTKREAFEALHRLSLFPVRVEDTEKGKIRIKFFAGKASDALIAATLEQLADLLENGVSVLAAFQILIKQTTNPVLREVIIDLHERIADGESIDSAFAAHNGVFDDLTISIIRAGTEGAFLEDALRRTAKFLEQQAEMKGKIVGALIYPAVLFVVGVTVTIVLLLFFVPQFTPFFEQAIANGGELPFTTRSLLKMRELLVAYGLYVIGIAVFILIWVQGQLSTRWGRRFMDRVKLKLPFIGSILLNSAVSRFCRVLGTLLENGVPILRALEISSTSTGNSTLSEAVKRSADNVSSGEALSKPLAETGIIPPQVMAMISVAEESNTLESVLVKVADAIERTTTRKLDTVIRLIEPFMLLTMAAMVFYIIVSMLLPTFNMGNMIQ